MDHGMAPHGDGHGPRTQGACAQRTVALPWGHGRKRPVHGTPPDCANQNTEGHWDLTKKHAAAPG